jgi:hypothetical protein
MPRNDVTWALRIWHRLPRNAVVPALPFAGTSIPRKVQSSRVSIVCWESEG